MTVLSIFVIVMTVISVSIILFFSIRKHYNFYKTYYNKRENKIAKEFRELGIDIHTDYHGRVKFIQRDDKPNTATEWFSPYKAGKLLHKMQSTYYMSILKPYFEKEMKKLEKEKKKLSYTAHKG